MSIGANLEKYFSLEGKVALLTGAAGGIGFELARGLANAGAAVCLCDVRTDGLPQRMGALYQPQRHSAHALDVTDKQSREACVDDILKARGRIDILVNCAGINKREGYLDVTEETYDRIMAVNLKGVFFLTQYAVLRGMRHTGGKIVNIGSINTTSMLGGVSVYGATKSAIYGLTRSMAIEWAKWNIQANCIAPGHILTQLTVPTWQNEHRAQYLRDRIAMQRPGEPQELIGITLLLCAPASSYMTGQLYDVDGGALAGGKPWNFDTAYE